MNRKSVEYVFDVANHEEIPFNLPTTSLPTHWFAVFWFVRDDVVQ